MLDKKNLGSGGVRTQEFDIKTNTDVSYHNLESQPVSSYRNLNLVIREKINICNNVMFIYI
jgi:hypothetical protein